MSTFRQEKAWLMQLFKEPQWQKALQKKCSDLSSTKKTVNALLPFLMRSETRWQAIWGVGLCINHVATLSKEDARTFMRRFMWSLNEESGNLGWGVLEAMGSTLARQSQLAQEYYKILLSYITDTGREDNYIEHSPLRQGGYWAAGHLAKVEPQKVAEGLHALCAGCFDELMESKGLSVWAITRLLQASSTEEHCSCIQILEEHALTKELEKLAHHNDTLTFLQDDNIRTTSIAELVKELQKLIQSQQ